MDFAHSLRQQHFSRVVTNLKDESGIFCEIFGGYDIGDMLPMYEELLSGGQVMPLCDELLTAKYHQFLIASSAARSGSLMESSHSPNRIWNPAFIETEWEKKTKHLLLKSSSSLDLLTREAARRVLVPPCHIQVLQRVSLLYHLFQLVD